MADTDRQPETATASGDKPKGGRTPRLTKAMMEHALATRGRPYVAIDEAKRALFADAERKPFDFIVYRDGDANLLVDVGPRNAASLAKMRTWTKLYSPGFLPAFARTRRDGRIVFVAAATGRVIPTTLGLAWSTEPIGKETS